MSGHGLKRARRVAGGVSPAPGASSRWAQVPAVCLGEALQLLCNDAPSVAHALCACRGWSMGGAMGGAAEEPLFRALYRAHWEETEDPCVTAGRRGGWRERCRRAATVDDNWHGARGWTWAGTLQLAPPDVVTLMVLHDRGGSHHLWTGFASGQLACFELLTGAELHRWRAHATSIRHLYPLEAAAPMAKGDTRPLLVTVSVREVRIWTTYGGEPARTLPMPLGPDSYICMVNVSDDGRRLALLSSRHLALMELATGRLLWKLPLPDRGHQWSVLFGEALVVHSTLQQPGFVIQHHSISLAAPARAPAGAGAGAAGDDDGDADCSAEWPAGAVPTWTLMDASVAAADRQLDGIFFGDHDETHCLVRGVRRVFVSPGWSLQTLQNDVILGVKRGALCLASLRAAPLAEPLDSHNESHPVPEHVVLELRAGAEITNLVSNWRWVVVEVREAGRDALHVLDFAGARHGRARLAGHRWTTGPATRRTTHGSSSGRCRPAPTLGALRTLRSSLAPVASRTRSHTAVGLDS